MNNEKQYIFFAVELIEGITEGIRLFIWKISNNSNIKFNVLIFFIFSRIL